MDTKSDYEIHSAAVWVYNKVDLTLDNLEFDNIRKEQTDWLKKNFLWWTL